jgi:endonuclease-3
MKAEREHRPKPCRRIPRYETIERALREVYGQPAHFNERDPLDEIIFIILSTQTLEREYRRTFANLRARYATWEDARQAPASEIEELIRIGGFAKIKAALVKELLDRLYAERGTVSLEFLRGMVDAAAFEYLCTLPGMGPKTSRCVLMYSLDREVFPVDTHAWRIARRLGWALGGSRPTARQMEALERAIPSRLRYSLHVTMIAHGRAACRAIPACGECPIRRLCPQLLG